MSTSARISARWKNAGHEEPKRSLTAGVSGPLTHRFSGEYRRPDAVIRQDMKLVRARCKEMGQNSPIIKSFKETFLNNVLGPHGMHFQMKIQGPDGKVDTWANNFIERAYKRGMNRANYLVSADMTKRLADEVKLLAIIDSGECFIRTHRNFDNEYLIAREIIDADTCDMDYNVAEMEGGGQIRMGIEFDKWGRRVAYYFLTRPPGDYQYARSTMQRERVPARDVRHLYVPLRPGQSRGIPLTAQAILSVRQIEAFIDAAVVNARVGAARNVYYQKNHPQGWTPADGALDDTGAIVDDLREGESLELPYGVEAKMLDTRFPDASIDPFVKCGMRFNAMALGTSYMTLSGDLSEANFSSLRAGLNEERSSWARWQQFFIESDCQPDFEEWLNQGLTTQKIPLPDSKFEKFNAAKFTGRRWSSVNPLQDANADIANINNLLMSRSEVIEARGADPEEVLAQIAEDKANADALGLTAESDPSLAAEILKESIANDKP